MLKIQLLSDIHLETHPHWRATPVPGADLLGLPLPAFYVAAVALALWLAEQVAATALVVHGPVALPAGSRVPVLRAPL